MMYTQSAKAVTAYKHQGSVRWWLRNLALDFLSWRDVASGLVARSLAQPRIHLVYLHYLFPDEVQDFRKLMAQLANTHKFINYSEAVEMLLRGETPQVPYICFSSDDGFKNNQKLAAILEEFDARACFFVCPDLVGVTDFDRLKQFCHERLNYPPMQMLTWEDLRELQARGHEIGCHTRNHPDLHPLSTSALENEITAAKRLIEAEVGPIHHFAWPYGLFKHFSENARNIVFEAGFRSCASAERGAHTGGIALKPAALCLRRDQLVAAWPTKHSLYFLAKSARTAQSSNNNFML